MSNRFLLAKQLNHGDELVWYKKRPNGERWRCLWRRHVGSSETNDSITFLAQDVNDGGNVKAEKVKIVFTILLLEER